ncbi:unnamed protein product [Candida verbasci]|uniref:CCR4-Not complex component Not N-terminal domain-containing protein n=1 Tax=Candida verbasci TaxID=1227364 RepID=A0A9W4TS23_9ASCO|nr:unnamed protein product [Candida verbasci]
MANRKLQKEIDIIFKRVQEGLKDFNYHYERYESLQNVEDDSDLQREREKLSNDLKKEIKKLQKYREQIKHWLSNDAVNTLGPVGTSYSQKLLENKSLVEDAMETYKIVEKQTKLKSFSNQSIMMNMLDSRKEDSESDDSESEDYPPEALDVILLLKDLLIQLDESTEKFEHEHEKIASKKIRKNNIATIEAKKEKIQSNIVNNNYHKKMIKKLIKLLKSSLISDYSLIYVLKDELEKYFQDEDYDVKDYYDDIINPTEHVTPKESPISSPAIIKTLKPATTPVKPVTNWSASVAIPPKTKIDSIHYKNIIKSSSLSKTETNLFSDLNLVRVPPGIQDLVISFASKRNNDEFKILIDDESNKFNQFLSPLHKPYLPEIVQPNYYFQFTNFNFKHPTQLIKFQNYWNEVRSNFQFDKLEQEIKETQDLIFVFFYGFYYGLTPAENLIAENYLFRLGWKPYNVDNKKLYYWFKNIKQDKSTTQFEIGDYQVFDLNFWEIFIKYNFKFDYSLAQLKPSKSLI